MNDRIKKIRKEKKLSQEEFGSKIGIKKSAVSLIESGRNNPTEQMILSICREFNVNENWLRSGEGEMFLPPNRNDDIARLTKSLLNEESDSFKNRFVSMISNLTVDEWEKIEEKLKELVGYPDDKQKD